MPRAARKTTRAKKPTHPELLRLPDRLRSAMANKAQGNRRRMTGKALAGASGVDPGRISTLLKGQQLDGLRVDTVLRLADALDIPVGLLLSSLQPVVQYVETPAALDAFGVRKKKGK